MRFQLLVSLNQASMSILESAYLLWTSEWITNNQLSQHWIWVSIHNGVLDQLEHCWWGHWTVQGNEDTCLRMTLKMIHYPPQVMKLDNLLSCVCTLSVSQHTLEVEFRCNDRLCTMCRSYCIGDHFALCGRTKQCNCQKNTKPTFVLLRST